MEKIFAGFFWWWMIHHSVHHYGMVIGHFPYLNPKTDFTNEELGVPPDSEGLAPVIPHVRTTVCPGANHGQWFFTPYYLKWKFGDEGWWKM